MAEQILRRHPIRGLLYGIFFGLGLAFVAVGQGWAALGTTPPIILFVVGLVVGTAWGIFGPAKKPKGPEPVEVTPTTPAEPAPPVPPADDVTAEAAAGDTVDDSDAGDNGDVSGEAPRDDSDEPPLAPPPAP